LICLFQSEGSYLTTSLPYLLISIRDTPFLAVIIVTVSSNFPLTSSTSATKQNVHDLILVKMASQRSKSFSNFLDDYDLPTDPDPSLGAEWTTTQPPSQGPWGGLTIEREVKSESDDAKYSSDDEEVDEEEVIYALDEGAMSELPLHLQKNMRELQMERYYRLVREDPNIKIRTGWSCPWSYGPPKPVPIPHSTSLPPWFAPPPDFEAGTNFRHFGSQFPEWSDPAFSRSFNVHSRTNQTWVATAPCQGNAFRRPRAVSAGAAHYLNLNTRSIPPPQKQETTRRRPKSRKHKHVKFEEERNSGGHSRFSSLSLRPVATNFRARVKKSIQRLNRLIKR
jgi:hypothetical protein